MLLHLWASQCHPEGSQHCPMATDQEGTRHNGTRGTDPANLCTPTSRWWLLVQLTSSGVGIIKVMHAAVTSHCDLVLP